MNGLENHPHKVIIEALSEKATDIAMNTDYRNPIAVKRASRVVRLLNSVKMVLFEQEWLSERAGIDVLVIASLIEETTEIKTTSTN